MERDTYEGGAVLALTLSGTLLFPHPHPYSLVFHQLPPAEGAEPVPVLYERINDRWEIAISISDGQFQQVSFVNAICTTKGGQHVNYIADQVCPVCVCMFNPGRC